MGRARSWLISTKLLLWLRRRGGTAILWRAYRCVGDTVLSGGYGRIAFGNSQDDMASRAASRDLQSSQAIADWTLCRGFVWLGCTRSARHRSMVRRSYELWLEKLKRCLRDRVPGHQHHIKRHTQKRECSGKTTMPVQGPQRHSSDASPVWGRGQILHCAWKQIEAGLGNRRERTRPRLRLWSCR